MDFGPLAGFSLNQPPKDSFGIMARVIHWPLKHCHISLSSGPQKNTLATEDVQIARKTTHLIHGRFRTNLLSKGWTPSTSDHTFCDLERSKPFLCFGGEGGFWPFTYVCPSCTFEV